MRLLPRGRQFALTALIVSLFAVGRESAPAAWAQTAPPSSSPSAGSVPMPVYETTVTSLRMPRPLPDVPGSVTVIPREEIDRTPALGADDLVRLVPSAATFRRTPSLAADPTSQGLNLRGVGPSGVSRALVLVDGVPVNDPFGGWIYWRSLPRLGIERIEVAPGGTSALYGNFALGGVLHFVSRPLSDRLQADVALGSLGTRTMAVAAGIARDTVAAAIEAEGLDSDGYVPVAFGSRGAVDQSGASRHGAVNGRVEFTPSAATRLGLTLRLFDERQNGGSAFTTARVRTGDVAATLFTQSARLGRLDVATFAGLQRFQQNRARITADRSSETLSAQQRVPSESQGASIVWTSPTLSAGGTHVLMVGSDLRRVTGFADETLFLPQVMPTSVVRRRSGGEQRFAGLFAQELYTPAPWIEVALSGRVDIWQNRAADRRLTMGNGEMQTTAFSNRSAVELSPRMGFLLRPSADVRFRGTVYRAFRAPTLNELYRPFQVGTIVTAANADLASERLVGADLGVEALLTDLGVLRLTGFWNRLVDPIVNATLRAPVAGPSRQRQNLGAAGIHGVEASGESRLGRHVIVAASYTLAEGRVTESTDAALLGNFLPQDPVHRGRLALAFVHQSHQSPQSHPRAEISVQARAQSGQFEDDANRLAMDGFVTFDVFAAAPITRAVSVFATVQNLLDERYLVGRAGIDTIGPPFLFLAGLRLR